VFLIEPHAADGRRWWIEGRPDEGGRQALIRREPDGTLTRMTPEGFNTRSRVHEYGGAAYLVSGDLVVVSDFATGRLNRIVRPGELEPLTPEKEWRFADAIHDAARNRLIAVREDHEPDVVAEHGEWNNELVAIDLATGEVSVLAKGSDFYARPRLSPDGTMLAWLEWHHPNMPWDGTELRLAEIAEDGSLADPRDHRRQPHRVDQPAPAGRRRRAPLRRRADRLDEPVPLGRRQGEQITNLEAELVGPDWQFGYTTYTFLPGGDILASRGAPGGRAHPDRPRRVDHDDRRALHGDELAVGRRRSRAPPWRRAQAALRRWPSSTCGAGWRSSERRTRTSRTRTTSRPRSTSSSRPRAGVRPSATTTRRPARRSPAPKASCRRSS
jgi:hypothetical protein